MIRRLLCSALMLFFSYAAMAQCLAPASATITPSPAACQGQGLVVARVDNPPAGAVYQYQLQYDSTGNTAVVKPWQASDTFSQVSVGRYKAYIRQVCGTSFSSVYVSSSTTVSGTTTPLSITQATALNKSACSNGKLSVTATGGNTAVPYRYALVPTLNEPEPVANYVRPQQSSNIFSGLSTGTYYARVYDTCGTYASATVVIDTVTENVSLTTNRGSYIFYACDSLRFVYSVSPNTRIQTGAPDSAERFWVRYNGVTDTLTLPANVGNYYLSGNAYKTDINKRIKPIAYPAQIAYGYKSVCGTVYENTVTVQAPVMKLVLISNSISCTQRQYNISVRDSASNNIAAYYNTRLSLDSGTTWSALNPSYQYYDTFTVGDTYNIWVASACDTEKVAATVVLPALSVVMSPFTSYSCNGNSGFALQAVNYSGNVDSVKFNVLSKPAGSTLPDSFYLIQTSGLSGSNFGYRLSYDITPGAYSLKATDACGATQTLNKTINPTTVAFTTAPLLSCLPSQSGFRVTVTETNYQPSFGFSPIRVIVTNTATSQVDSFTNNTNITTRPVNVDVTGLVNGTYTLRVIKVRPTGALGLPYPACSVNGTYTNTSNQPLSLTQSTFTSACTNGTATIAAQVQGGGGGNQFYVDLQAGSSWTQVAGPQSSAVFNNLLPNSIYRVRVTDACGNGTQYSTSFSNAAPAMNYSSTTAPCSGDTFMMSVAPNSAATYTWQKNSSPVAGAVGNSYTLNPVPPAGSPVDTYRVKIAYGSCDVFSVSYAVDPTLCGRPLPISLVSFSGFMNGPQAQLRWEVARYESVNTFDVEYSADGKQFERIAAVPCNNTSYYQYTDVSRKASSLYYRLKMTGTDGEHSYSRVIRLNGKDDNTGRSIKLYPTVITDKLHLNYTTPEQEQLHWRFFSMEGKLVLSGETMAAKGVSVLTLDHFAALPAGTYIFNLSNGTSFNHKEKVIIRK